MSLQSPVSSLQSGGWPLHPSWMCELVGLPVRPKRREFVSPAGDWGLETGDS
jgi:hypothetical protein